VDAVLNWLWQGAVVVVATAAILPVIEPYRAQARYSALWAAFLLVLLLPVVPLIWGAASPASAVGGVGTSVVPIMSIPTGWWTSSAVAIALGAVWSIAFAGRLARAGVALQRAKRNGRQLPPAVEARLRYWARVRTTGRKTRVVVSSSVRSAAILGCRSPVIAVAPTLLHHLTDEELDRVVIHEWAHVQRRDDVAHLVQLLVRVVAGWHPAVCWFDRRLHIEREIACDQMAVAVTGSAKAYAACLTKLASLPGVSRRSLPAVAALSSAGLRHRIVRILSHDRVAPARFPRAVAAATGIWLCALAVTVGRLQFIEAGASIADIGASRADVGATAQVVLPDALGTSSRVVPSPTPQSSIEPVGARPQPSARRSRPTAVRGGLTREPVATARAMSIPPPSTDSAVSSHAAAQPLSSVSWLPTVAVAAPDSSLPSVTASGAPGSVSTAPSMTDVNPVSPWGATADAGVAVGRGSQKAALATAGFFSRFGRKIAGSF